MNQLIEIQERLQETTAALARAQRSLIEFPDRPSLRVMLSTFEKRQRALEADFLTIANELGLDVCSYQIETDPGRPTLLAVASVLASFQRLFTSVYDAIVNGPKQTAKVGADVTEITSLGFAYTFPGSLGVMLTIENERLLADETHLDEAMRGVFSIVKARDSQKVHDLAKSFGLASIRLAHQWASENAKAGFGAKIDWRRKDDVRSSVAVQRPEIIHLERVIQTTTNEHKEVFVGDLVAVDTDNSTFRMRVDGKDIAGTYRSAITREHRASLPKRYSAIMNVTKTLLLTDDEEPISYFLVHLDEPAS